MKVACGSCGGLGRVSVGGATCPVCRGQRWITRVAPERWRLVIVAWAMRLPGAAPMIEVASKGYGSRGVAKAMMRVLLRKSRVALGDGVCLVPMIYDPAGKLVEVHCATLGDQSPRWHGATTAPARIWSLATAGVA